MLTNNWWLMRARNVFLVFHYCKAVAEKRGMNVCIGTQTASGETAKLYNKNTLSETWSINTAECDNTAEKVLKTEAWTMRNNEFANSGSKSKLIFGDEMTDVPIKCFTIHEQQQQQQKKDKVHGDNVRDELQIWEKKKYNSTSSGTGRSLLLLLLLQGG